MQDNIFQKIDNMIDDIYESFKLEYNNKDLKKVIEKLGGNLIIGNKNSITKVDKKFIIELDSKLIASEKRKKLYELIGYLFLIMGYTIDYDIWKKSKNLSLKNIFGQSYFKFITTYPYLNYFGKAFLLPKSEFIRIWELERTDLTVDIVSMSKTFDVSTNEIIDRAKDLELIDSK